MQIEKARRLDIVEDIYYEIIEKKTASLISAACGVGTAAVTENQEHIEAMQKLGTTIGICFQMKDDLFDYGYNNIGKPTGIDIKEKKLTLPLIYALNQSSYSEKRSVIKKVKSKSEKKQVRTEIIEFVKAKGGLEYAEERMIDYKNKALSILTRYPDGPAKTALENLVEFVVARKT